MTAIFEFVPSDPVGRGRLTRKTWTLCLGAGINVPMMPSWEDLARNLTNRFCSQNLSADDFREICATSRWPLEAWIQQALNQHVARDGEINTFLDALREELYKTIDRIQTAERLTPVITDALCSTTSLSKQDWLNTAAFFDQHFGQTTAYRLARLFVDNADLPLPESVITFNADTLFETMYVLLKKKKINEATSDWIDPRQTFARVVRSSEDVWGHIPIYHLHGCLPPKSTRHSSVRQNPENMIFPENTYTGIARSVFTWSQNTFLHKVLTNTLCFVGLSMSDPNIRRWLAWAYEMYVEDLRTGHDVRVQDLGGRHVWLQSREGMRHSR
jgi:SIR2-like protein